MKSKQNHKPPKERLETLASVAGRNINLSIASELLEMERRVERLERVCRKLLNMQKVSADVGMES